MPNGIKPKDTPMAQYRLETKHVSRSKGRPATAAAAYQAAIRLKDLRSNHSYSYDRKQGVIFTEIITPDHSEIGRSELWNNAELTEKRKDARTAREFILNLPHEIPNSEKIALARQFTHYLINRYKIAADIAIHEPPKNGDQRNWHAHILTTTRIFSAGNLTEKSDIELSDKDRRKLGLSSGADEITHLRSVFEQMTNDALARSNITARVNSHKLSAQGIKRPPTVHLGPRFTALERKGIHTHRGNHNRLLTRQNNLENAELETRDALTWIHGEINKLEQEIALEFKAKTTTQPAHNIRSIFAPLTTPTPQKPASQEANHYRHLYLAHYRRIAKHTDTTKTPPPRLDLYIAMRLLTTGHNPREITRAIYYIRRKSTSDTKTRTYARIVAQSAQKAAFDLASIKPNLLALETRYNPAWEQTAPSPYETQDLATKDTTTPNKPHSEAIHEHRHRKLA